MNVNVVRVSSSYLSFASILKIISRVILTNRSVEYFKVSIEIYVLEQVFFIYKRYVKSVLDIPSYMYYISFGIKFIYILFIYFKSLFYKKLFTD